MTNGGHSAIVVPKRRPPPARPTMTPWSRQKSTTPPNWAESSCSLDDRSFDADQQPLAADIADILVALEALQRIEEVGADLGRATDELFRLQNLDVAQRHGGRHRVTAIGVHCMTCRFSDGSP
jgi:hypothetical protein